GRLRRVVRALRLQRGPPHRIRRKRPHRVRSGRNGGTRPVSACGVKSPHSFGGPSPVLMINAADPDAAFARASDFYQRGMFDEAEMVCESLLTKAPRHVHGLHLLAFIRSRQGRHDDAALLMKKVVKQRPGNAEALY